MWSFVGSKKEKRWIWLAMDQTPAREGKIIGFWIGDRSKNSAEKFYQSMPEVYRRKSDFYTDFYKVYGKIFDEKNWFPNGKEVGYTNHIERFNGTLRARCSRLVRENYAFSKSDTNHRGIILNFINHYNQTVMLRHSKNIT
jgi:IS1 family transposase